MRRWPKACAALSAVALTLGLSVVIAPAANAAAEAPIAAYDFTSAPADNATVPNAVAGEFGPAVVQNPAANLWQDKALTFTGGSKTSTGSWVRLPDNLLTDQKSATVQMEVKADQSMISGFHFLWNIGNSAAETEYFFATVNCSNNRNPLVGIKSGGSEKLVQAKNCGVKANEWLSVTSVIDGETSPATASFYINGVKVASQNVSSTPADVLDQTLNTIGRAPWPDPLFKGAVANFRVFDSALADEEIAAISDADALLHEGAIKASAQAVLESLNINDTTVTSPYFGFPTAGGTVTWHSSNENVIETNGTVHQPSKGSAPVVVELTATTQLRGQTATKTITATVNPMDKDDAQIIADLASAYVVPSVIQAGTKVPAAVAGSIVKVVGSDGITVAADGTVTISGDAAVTGTITTTVSKSDVAGLEQTREFAVTVLPKSESTQLLSYHRNATSHETANNGDVAYSMHLALEQRNEWNPLNENYGIFFARNIVAPVDATDVVLGSHRSLKDPALFHMKDGTFGVVSVRTNQSTANADASGKTSILLATSSDLLAFDEAINSKGIINVGETNGVNKPYAVYDSAEDVYLVSWVDDGGVPKYTTFKTLVDATSPHGEVHVGKVAVSGEVATTGIDDYVAGRSIAISAAQIAALEGRYGRIVNTGVKTPEDVSAALNSDIVDLELPGKAELTYSDGSLAHLPIENWDTSAVDLTTPGTYPVTGTIKQTEYPLPFAEDRADPTVHKWEWTRNGITEIKYLMIATNDIHGDNVWQRDNPHMPFRMADSIAELADTPGDPSGLITQAGFNPKESILLKKGDKNADGQVITGSLWAPEIHEINGTLSILFMPSYNSYWMDGAAAIMQLKNDANGDPMDPSKAESWTVPQTVTRQDGKPLSLRTNGTQGMSLDMNYFEDETGQAYYTWQQLGAVYIAKMDPTDPAKVTSEPRLIISPEYAWDNAIAEGPNVINRDGKLYMIYSGSGVGPTYTTGLAIADASGATDLTTPAAWEKLNYPIQKSGIFNGEWQLGTGHGMWSEDEDGNMIYVFHAYAKHTEGYSNVGGRDTFIRRVHWAADGLPVFDMNLDEEVAPGTVVSLNVVVAGDVTEPGDGDGDGSGDGNGSDGGSNPGDGNGPGADNNTDDNGTNPDGEKTPDGADTEGKLPVTGANPLPFILIGVVLLVAGAAMIIIRKLGKKN
ncbi:family 43 glycosylhydrolase [Jonesiaceae bacterium BS-20]|uniref:Family 43 glycosylhydrolase n=1 Tax=Jonesiaceae bacterium BS-20 TaxID=3120821 RepID=A0AAU7DVJ5_9MICO